MSPNTNISPSNRLQDMMQNHLTIKYRSLDEVNLCVTLIHYTNLMFIHQIILDIRL